MPSPLMPADTDKELHLKLLDLLEDATQQFNALNQLHIPEKTKIKAQIEYNACAEKFVTLPSKSSLAELANDNQINTPRYRSVCRDHYYKFVDFYDGLEILIVHHYQDCKIFQGNEYLVNALNKIPDKSKVINKSQLESLPLSSPRSQNSPRKSPRSSPRTPHEEVSNREGFKGSPRKRGNSHAIMPLSLMSASKISEHKVETPRPRSGSCFKL